MSADGGRPRQQAARSFAEAAAPAGFFVLRTPMLPVSALTAWCADLSAPDAADEDLPAALIADTERLTTRLRAAVERPEVREAIFYASPSLDDATRAWLRDPSSPRARGTVNILARYFTRMASRCTPFGLFSSCGLGTLCDEATALRVVDRTASTRHTRLDMEYVDGLVRELERDPSVRAGLRFAVSSGLYRLGDRLHYAEADPHDKKAHIKSYKLVSLDVSAELTVALERAANGARPGEIADALRSVDPALDEETAAGYAEELIDAQVVVSELAPPITGPEPIHHVIRVLRERGVGGEVAAALEGLRDALVAHDARGIGQPTSAYEVLAARLSDLPAPVDPARIVQVDLERGFEGTVGPELRATMEEGVEVLRRIATEDPDGELHAFALAFRDRWEAREVPLPVALDEDVGIGFAGLGSVPSGLLDDLPFPVRSAPPHWPFGARETRMMARLQELAAKGETVWELDEADVRSLGGGKDPAPLPGSLFIQANVAARGADAIARGEYAVHLAVVGAGASEMLGRFCHGDRALHDAVIAHVGAEEALEPDTVFAEIVHRPEGRIGNILLRPVLRPWEIPYLASSGVDPDHRIGIEDLLVSVSASLRVRLRSRRLGKWVEPRMASAHNPRATSLGVYRFLCALRHGAAPSLLWSWGPFAGLPHLPRVACRRAVFALEQWNLGRADLEPLGKAEGAARFVAVRAMRRRLRLPRWISLSDHDNILPVDLENAIACETFVELVKNRSGAQVTEVFPGPDEHFVTGADGAYAAEIVIPYVARRPPAPARPVPVASRATRDHAPGSPWLYVKIYCGRSTADAVLREIVAPVLRDAVSGGIADAWFFIRYADPKPHLRVRFHGARERFAELLAGLHDRAAGMLASGLIERIVVDTYQREVERYGGDDAMDLSEALFRADSDAALAVAASFDGVHDGEVRWRLTLLGLDRLLDDLGFDLARKLALLRKIRDAFAAEHHAAGALDHAIGARFRKHRGELERLLQGTPPAEAAEWSLDAGIAALQARSVAIAPTARALGTLAARGDLDLDELAASYLHMHANRMLAADHRAQELVLYDFLARIYESRAARAKKNAASPASA